MALSLERAQDQAARAAAMDANISRPCLDLELPDHHMNRSASLRTLTFAALCALSLVHPEANAECFSMYTANNVLAYESGTSPIDLSRPISAEMARRFPARYLVISTTASCGDNTIDMPSGRSDGGAGGSAATTGPGDKSNPYDAPKAQVRAARRR